MPDKTQFVGRWVHWEGPARIEQELFADGRFKGIVFDEEKNAVFGTAEGTWEIIDDSICWRYLAAENIPISKKPDINPILHVDANRFDLREASRRRCDWHRLVPSEETSTNFDYEQVQPFLERIAASIDSGFGDVEITALMKKMRRLKHGQTYQVVLSISYQGVQAPFRIRAFMDDVDAPDIYFYAPVELTRRIDDEIKKLDTQAGG